MPVKINPVPRQNQPESDSPPQALSPELVQAVAERVYAMLLQDLQLAAERHRPAANHRLRRHGGG